MIMSICRPTCCRNIGDPNMTAQGDPQSYTPDRSASPMRSPDLIEFPPVWRYSLYDHGIADVKTPGTRKIPPIEATACEATISLPSSVPCCRNEPEIFLQPLSGAPLIQVFQPPVMSFSIRSCLNLWKWIILTSRRCPQIWHSSYMRYAQFCFRHLSSGH